MTRRPWADLGVGAGVGGFSGLLGVGGGIFLVPYLTSIRRIPQKRAQATSLVMVSMGAASGTITYALNDSVAWLPALLILIGGLAGAWAGAHLVQRLHDRRLRIAFGVILLLTALRLVLPGLGTSDTLTELPALTLGVVTLYVVGGIAMGLLSALFGIGGGIIIVPILVTVLGYEQQLANGTSLAVMTAIALFGAARLTQPGLTDWRSGLTIGAAAVIGAAVGALVALAIPAEAIRIVFAVVLILVGAHMIREGLRMPRGHQEEPPAVQP